LKNNIASKSYGIKYIEEDIPRWNTTFTAGALRSKERVHFGTYNVRAKTRLFANCVSFITFSMILPVKDPIHSNSGYWDEIALGFSSKEKKKVFLFIKSDHTEKERHKTQILIPITIEDPKFMRSEYNNYKLKWETNSITLSINGKIVYKTLNNHPVPKLPGYTYFIIRPDYNTNNNELLKKIKNKEEPNIKIKSYNYTPM
jgi:beta-glucanase (GH16 family)